MRGAELSQLAVCSEEVGPSVPSDHMTTGAYEADVVLGVKKLGAKGCGRVTGGRWAGGRV